jgi:WhiB family redox-sensing transcriptional regulator
MTTHVLPAPRSESYQWQLDAACRGMETDLFFHPYGERDPSRSRRVQQAKAICTECPVRLRCAEHAVRVGEVYGVWGGLSEEERAELRTRGGLPRSA